MGDHILWRTFWDKKESRMSLSSRLKIGFWKWDFNSILTARNKNERRKYIRISFSHAIENRLALRYTDWIISHITLYRNGTFSAIRHEVMFTREEDFPTGKGRGRKVISVGDGGLLSGRGCNVTLSHILPIFQLPPPPPLPENIAQSLRKSFFHKPIERLVYWQPYKRLIWSIDRSSDRLIDRAIDRSIDWLIDWLLFRKIEWPV